MTGRQAKRQEASIYVDDSGRLVGSKFIELRDCTVQPSPPEVPEGPPPPPPPPETKVPTEPEASTQSRVETDTTPTKPNRQTSPAGRVCAGCWQVIVATVDCRDRQLRVFVDGNLAGEATVADTDIDGSPSGLSLGTRIVLFGGGKQSESRGGERSYSKRRFFCVGHPTTILYYC